MSEEELLILLKKYESGKCSEQDLELLNEWFSGNFPEEDRYTLNSEEEASEIESRLAELKNIAAQKQRKTIQLKRYRWVSAAAAILLLIVVSGILINNKNKRIIPTISAVQTKDILPGKNGAVLTLANGTQVLLDSVGNGNIAVQHNVQIHNINGLLEYNTANKNDTAIAYNTLATPNARQYQLVLPDGSKVWLNAASSIRFPIAFNGKDRIVEITGEAYFEVVHNSRQPFKVKTGGQEIEDIGTGFNVNAYEPAIKTTLVEGSVRVNDNINKKSVLLKPGEQSITQNGIKVVKVDIEEATDWKNGYFIFNDESIDAIMKKVARWYNVQVEFAPGVSKNTKFGGTISRTKNLSSVLKLMEMTGRIHFDIQKDNKIVVSE